MRLYEQANIVLALYLGLLIVTDVVPSNGWHAVWMTAFISFSVSSVYAVAMAHSNPLKRMAAQSVQREVLDGLLATNREIVFPFTVSKGVRVTDSVPCLPTEW